MVSCEFCEFVRNTIFTDHLETPASVFIEHICISQNLVLISQGGFSNLHVKSKLRERENLFSFFTSLWFVINLLLSEVKLFHDGGPYHIETSPLIGTSVMKG